MNLGAMSAALHRQAATRSISLDSSIGRAQRSWQGRSLAACGDGRTERGAGRDNLAGAPAAKAIKGSDWGGASGHASHPECTRSSAVSGAMRRAAGTTD